MRLKVLILIAFLISVSIPTHANTNEYHPLIFALRYKETKFSAADFFGGSQNGNWYKLSDFKMKLNDTFVSPDDFLEDESINGKQVDIDIVKGGELFKIYSSNTYIATVKGEKPTFWVDGYANEILTVKFSPVKSNEDFIIGINGEWNAMPRIPKKISKSNSFSIDIEGDGKDEILKIEKSRVESKDENNKSYFEPGVKVIISKNNRDILVNEIPLDGVYTAKFKVLTIDLNGDGKLELLTLGYGHTVSLAFFEISNFKSTQVLGYYVGD